MGKGGADVVDGAGDGDVWRALRSCRRLPNRGERGERRAPLEDGGVGSRRAERVKADEALTGDDGQPEAWLEGTCREACSSRWHRRRAACVARQGTTDEDACGARRTPTEVDPRQAAEEVAPRRRRRGLVSTIVRVSRWLERGEQAARGLEFGIDVAGRE